MPDDLLKTSNVAEAEPNALRADLMKPVIKVLIYTDHHHVADDLRAEKGIGALREHLAAHTPAFADRWLTLVNRNSDAHADRKLAPELECEYDQVWFFGIHQANIEDHFNVDFGGPHSELESDEIEALDSWMKVDKKGGRGIGILVSGDHANPPPEVEIPQGEDPFCPGGLDHSKFLGLGRAIGKGIPRAGQMREWEGPPTHCFEDSFNTLNVPRGGSYEDFGLQLDAAPQSLELEHFDSQGNPDPRGEPHAIFKGRNKALLKFLPDHGHEGKVIAAGPFPEDIWCRGPLGQPRPQVIAYGTDRRRGNKLNTLAAYDGDSVSLGRIVADSSWHHYFNGNLSSLPADSPPGSSADQIGQLYSNLTIWLSPLAKRRQMGQFMIAWLATHPDILEQVGSGALNIGRVAARLVRQAASECEIEELLLAVSPDWLRSQFAAFRFHAEVEAKDFPSLELLLGSIVNEYHRAVRSRRVSAYLDASEILSAVAEGIKHALALNTLKAISVVTQALGICQNLPGFVLSSKAGSCLDILKDLTSDNLLRRGGLVMGKLEWGLTMTVDRVATQVETFDLTVTVHGCSSTGATTICPVTGRLVKKDTGEGFDVAGSYITSIFPSGVQLEAMHIEFPFRNNVKILMAGPVFGDYLARYKAVKANFKGNARDIPTRPGEPESAPPALGQPINPVDGDTGTGTGTQTRLVEGRQGGRNAEP